ncbi:MAG: hypothetical protein RIR33_406 [Pseudomonadota bacterium]|jgi:hypothetical protein
MTTTPEGFFLYAETHLPHEEARSQTLVALQMCADGTAAVTPSVATYIFRRSAAATLIGERIHNGALSLESTELYLNEAGFRDHILTDDFRAGLRMMYKEVKRLGTRLFWIGATPPSDMLHNICRSDPDARPVAAVIEKLFDRTVYDAAKVEDVIIASALFPVDRGRAADVIDGVRQAASALKTISFAAFFHPIAQEFFRVFFVAPVSGDQTAEKIASAIAPINQVASPGLVLGTCQTHRSRPDLAARLRHSLNHDGANWEVSHEDYSGYILHPTVRG